MRCQSPSPLASLQVLCFRRPLKFLRFDRSFESNSMNDHLGRVLLEEVIFEVERHRTPDGYSILLSEGPEREGPLAAQAPVLSPHSRLHGNTPMVPPSLQRPVMSNVTFSSKGRAQISAYLSTGWRPSRMVRRSSKLSISPAAPIRVRY